MKIAVTGCNGRIGRRVVLGALKLKHTVIGLDCILADDTEFREDPGFTFLQVDLKDFDEALKAFTGCDAIIQLASFSHPGDYKTATHNSNVVITWNVLRAAAELGITRVAQASSVNVYHGVFSKEPQFEYFPIDEDHPCLPDEPYGLSKVIAEMQADTIVRRYPSIRVASIRLHWSLPTRARAYRSNMERAKGDLWGYVQEDSTAEAFLLAVTMENGKWSGHEPFLIVAPQTACDIDTKTLIRDYWPNVPHKDGWEVSEGTGFYNCRKAEQLLGWVHKDV
ncbi:hypothetical protein SERLA73DRAFT_122837 [Serpula lacrymans var. lacrymans S7.3]|uniref:NAD-dependent epimerase/dehydratase domain-containing protein n=2 Tax=Serpula lacrymans var. lacrymans TaxID=341189 RepID=F8PYL5_SERL3|nr:uncharacterized protein SERLADRAFT_408489 [Serpula lacrymans var. lacrymans S7.9]EGN98978.1 hypothetical protein SERLA73DRAFT_122837 [Serpula lacrymans var. lacrymans S7.3]EGO24566.1 hypothetical protein SERLADRAFT_408489 [Serpula lacrymans var. lacrymans S7.9]